MNQKEIFNKYFNILRLMLIAKYDELGLRASGEYAKELEVRVAEGSAQMWSAVQAAFMQNGISPSGSKYGPVRAIEQWIETKSSLPAFFKENVSWLKFAIAKKIAKEGIKVPNQHNQGEVISSVLEEFIEKELPKMFEELGVGFITSFSSDIKNVLTKAA